MQDKEKPSSNALNPPSKTKALHSLTRQGRHGGVWATKNLPNQLLKQQ